MEFCDKCGSYMRKTGDGFLCPRCGNRVRSGAEEPVQPTREHDSGSVYVVDGSGQGEMRVSRSCPQCGNGEAFHWFSGVAGEHAGVRSERTVEHFRCSKCGFVWTKSS